MICNNCIHQKACINAYASMGYFSVIDETKQDEYKHTILECSQFEDKSKFQEVRHGKWIEDNDGVTRCSVCGHKANRNFYVNVQELSEFCPHCGAKMDL